MTAILTESPKTTIHDEIRQNYDGYFTIKFGKIARCNCGKRIEFVEPPTYHIVVVWEEKDDENLLKIAQHFKDKQQLNPRIVEYQIGFGPAIEYYEAIKRGVIT